MAGNPDGADAVVIYAEKSTHGRTVRGRCRSGWKSTRSLGFPSDRTNQQTPWASMASATFVKPAMFAPIT